MAFGFDGLEVVLFVEFLLDFVDGIDDGENDGPDLIRNFDTEVTWMQNDSWLHTNDKKDHWAESLELVQFHLSRLIN